MYCFFCIFKTLKPKSFPFSVLYFMLSEVTTVSEYIDEESTCLQFLLLIDLVCVCLNSKFLLCSFCVEEFVCVCVFNHLFCTLNVEYSVASNISSEILLLVGEELVQLISY